MNQIQRDDGTLISDHDSIMAEVTGFYENFYKLSDIEKDDPLVDLPTTSLTQQQSKDIEGVITMEELTNALKRMKNGKSPGPGGFTVEFYKAFWPELSTFLLRSINTSFKNGSLYDSQKLGSIILIPKGNKPRHSIRNWRPISLLNVSYKFASAVIAYQVKNVLPFLINEDQTGFVPGRYIGENVRLVYDLMQYTDLNKLNGLLLLIDFEKAFDMVSHDFILKTLNLFNFGPDIIQWFKILYTNMMSSVIVNGYLSKRIHIARGCRQGDPLSPVLI